MGCISTKPDAVIVETEAEKSAHVRRKTQHLIQNLVHEEYRLKVDEVSTVVVVVVVLVVVVVEEVEVVEVVAVVVVAEVVVSTCQLYGRIPIQTVIYGPKADV